VNQLYWKHRDAFEGMMSAGDRLGRAHASQLAGQAADTAAALSARREALSDLSRLARTLLRDAGHNPTPDMMLRITTTLEALSTYSSSPEKLRPGRLTDDVGPAGFESLAALIPDIERARRDKPTQVVFPQNVPPNDALEAAERTFHETQLMAAGVSEALKKATAHANETERSRREAKERYEKANLAAEDARDHLKNITAEAEKVAGMLKDAERRIEQARAALEVQSRRLKR